MVSENHAQLLLTGVRELFKGGFKSDNKVFATDEKGSNPLHMSERQAKRNQFQELSYNMGGIWRAQKEQQKLGDFEYGEFIYKTGALVGNCYEYACLAGYGASLPAFNFFHVYIGEISDPGDHIFCLIDYPHPRWDKVEKMKGALDRGWVIDPWANICCRPANYAARFQEKLNKWVGEGKRIAYQSIVNNFSGWTVPLWDQYVEGFLSGPLKFRACPSSKS